jgi:hypothetical protein
MDIKKTYIDYLRPYFPHFNYMGAAVWWSFFIQHLEQNDDILYCDNRDKMRQFVINNRKKKGRFTMERYWLDLLILLVRMFTRLDSRVKITRSSSYNLGLLVKVDIHDTQTIHIPGMIVPLEKESMIKYPSLMAINNRTCFVLGPIALLNHSCESRIYFSNARKLSTIWKDDSIWNDFSVFFRNTYQNSRRFIDIKIEQDMFMNIPKLRKGEIFVNYKASITTDDESPEKFDALNFECKCPKCIQL